MSKLERLNELYAAILTSCNHQVDDQGKVSLVIAPGNVKDVEIEGKRLVLPTDSNLRNPDPEKEIFFHPFSEQLQRGESEIFSYLKRSMLLKLITSASMIGNGLLALQKDAAAQRKMGMEHINMIKGIVDTDDQSSIHWLKMMFREITANPYRLDTWPINIFMRRNGMYDNKAFRRVAVVNFPLFEKIFAGEQFLGEGGKNLHRKKDYAMFRQVGAAMFPDLNNPISETFDTGYDGTLAPYTICFLRAYKKLADRINEILSIMQVPFQDLSSDYPTLAGINTDWWEMIKPENEDELAGLAKTVPPKKYNMGTSLDGTDTPSEEPIMRPASTLGRFSVSDKPAESPRPKEVEQEKPKADKPVLSNEGLNAEEIRQRDEAMRRREEFLKREAEDKAEEEARRERRRARETEERRVRDDRDFDRIQREREEDEDRQRERERRERRERGDREDRERERGRDRYHRDDDWDDDRDERSEVRVAAGKSSFSAIARNNPSVMERNRDRDRGDRGRGGSRYDDRDDRDYGRGSRYDDRGRSRYDDRDYDRGRDYGREYGRGGSRYDDRSYRR